MGAAICGCLITSLCLLPAAAKLESAGMVILLLLITVLPLILAMAPARVSSSCDDLYEGLTEIAFVGDIHHKNRCNELKRGLADLNIRQGLGFLVFGKVIDRVLLAKIAATLLSSLVTLVVSSHVQDTPALDWSGDLWVYSFSTDCFGSDSEELACGYTDCATRNR